MMYTHLSIRSMGGGSMFISHLLMKSLNLGPTTGDSASARIVSPCFVMQWCMSSLMFSCAPTRHDQTATKQVTAWDYVLDA